jgi:hypothetical protein
LDWRVLSVVDAKPAVTTQNNPMFERRPKCKDTAKKLCQFPKNPRCKWNLVTPCFSKTVAKESHSGPLNSTKIAV